MILDSLNHSLQPAAIGNCHLIIWVMFLGSTSLYYSKSWSSVNVVYKKIRIFAYSHILLNMIDERFSFDDGDNLGSRKRRSHA